MWMKIISYPHQTMFDAVYVPGGKKHIKKMLNDDATINFVNEAYKHHKTIGAFDEGVDLLKNSNIKGTAIAKSSDKKIIDDNGIITANNQTDINKFAESFIDAIKLHRHWKRQ